MLCGKLQAILNMTPPGRVDLWALHTTAQLLRLLFSFENQLRKAVLGIGEAVVVYASECHRSPCPTPNLLHSDLYTAARALQTPL